MDALLEYLKNTRTVNETDLLRARSSSMVIFSAIVIVNRDGLVIEWSRISIFRRTCCGFDAPKSGNVWGLYT